MTTVIVDKGPAASSSSVYGVSFFFWEKEVYGVETSMSMNSILRANVMPY